MVNKLIVRSNARANWLTKNKTTKLQKNETTKHENTILKFNRQMAI